MLRRPRGTSDDLSGSAKTWVIHPISDPCLGVCGSIWAGQSGSTGLYDISGLNPANYNLKVKVNGFGAFVQNGIAINVSSTVGVNVKLPVGSRVANNYCTQPSERRLQHHPESGQHPRPGLRHV